MASAGPRTVLKMCCPRMQALAAERAAMRQASVRPKRSASLILIDRSGSEPRLLLGRRGADQRFMPNKYVFPGGKTDRSDHRAELTAQLREQDRERVLRALGKRASAIKRPRHRRQRNP